MTFVLPMQRIIWCVAAGVLAIACLSPAHAKKRADFGDSTGKIDYYIAPTGTDGGRCSLSAPCKSIGSVDSRLGGALPLGTKGTTIHVAPGTYNLTCVRCGGAIVTSKSGNPSARIRYISDQRWAARIVTAGGSSSWNNRASFIDIVGFDISGDGPYGIEVNSSIFARILGNNVHHVHLYGGCSAGAGIVLASSSSDQDVIGNWVHDVGDMKTKCYQVQGIYAAGPRARIINNITDRNMGWGIHLWHGATEITVTNNTCFANGQGGIIVGCGDDGCIADDYTVVSNNLVMDNNGFGIIEQGITGLHNSYSNNLSYRNERGAYSLQNALSCKHCLVTDPQLVRYKSDGSGDYHLKSGSQAKGAGTGLPVTPIDFDGGLRPADAAWDIGAYEYGAKPGIWPWY